MCQLVAALYKYRTFTFESLPTAIKQQLAKTHDDNVLAVNTDTLKVKNSKVVVNAR